MNERMEDDEKISEVLWLQRKEIEEMIHNNEITSSQTIAAFEIAKRYIS